ncbi:PLP-dependent aminotransferase family protein [Gayadomonas joobiniege]|uniref:aminotransferase-like domain-containing protein n=1 Tax=Gayadomonas joobiniege TaxID=1234606 RepID=UPI00037D2F5A|nr:PLP-dependent aminotransferase family protein [Gayadomonas joobiniege]
MPFLYEKLAEHFRNKIENNSWPHGYKLPSIRTLSKHFDSSVVSVQKALHMLESSGLIYAKARSGFYVCSLNNSDQPQHSKQTRPPKAVTVPDIFYQIMEKSAAFDIYPSAAVTNELTHLHTLSRHINRSLRNRNIQNAMHYAHPMGNEQLRQQISLHYLSRNLYLDPAKICISNGCQNALFLALQNCCEPGDTVAIESPAFYGVLQILKQLKLKVIEISSSPTLGILPDNLEAAVKKWPIKALVVTPNFNTPTGSIMPDKHKKRLCELAEQQGFTIIEDDIYGDLSFYRTVSPLKSFDKHGSTILCGSFSKALSRDLRVGWVYHENKSDQLARLKMLMQLSGSDSVQQGLASFMAEGFYRRHLSQYNKQLLNQRNNLINALNAHWNFSFKYTIPEGGLCIWVELAPDKNSVELYKQALQQNIVLTPGDLFSISDTYKHFVRLSFASDYKDERLQALKKLADLM